MPRLFVGIELPEPVKLALLRAGGEYPSARWHAGHQLHLTLSFIGNVSPERVRDISHALRDLQGPAFELTINGVGYFGTPEKPFVIWAGFAACAELHRLQRQVAARLAALGLVLDQRPYAPHVTLARVKQGAPLASFLRRHAQLTAAPFPVEHVSLFLSSPSEQGNRYEVIERFTLV